MTSQRPSPEAAAYQAADVAAAYQQSSRPTIPRAVAVACALAAGVGTALLAQPWAGWQRLAALAVAAALLVIGFALPTLLRRRAGLRGYRGRSARDNTTYLLVGAVLVVCAVSPSPALGVCYAALGVVVAYVWFAVLRNHRWARR